MVTTGVPPGLHGAKRLQVWAEGGVGGSVWRSRLPRETPSCWSWVSPAPRRGTQWAHRVLQGQVRAWG